MARYRVSELARMSGVGPRTIDYYTQQQLLDPVERSEGGHRFYGEEALFRVRAIKAWQASGLPLNEIRARLSTPETGTEVLSHAEQVRLELQRIEREVIELGQQIALLEPASESRIAAERALQASMLCALTLAQKVAGLLSDAHIPFV
jgi:MerR family transcriptional regulator, copper efflux regulator